MSKLIPIQNILNIYDYSRQWMFIPGFNGYEISNDCYIRSMKHYRKYPFGVLINPMRDKRNKNTDDPLYELSDNDNNRKRIRLSEIKELVLNNKTKAVGYPRATMVGSNSGRNKFVKNDDGVYVKVYNGPGARFSKRTPKIDNRILRPKFAVVEDNSESLNMPYIKQERKVPIKSTKGDEYYGRKDC